MFQSVLRRWLKRPPQTDQAVSSPEAPEPAAPLPPQSPAGRFPARTPRLTVEVCDLADETLVRLQGEGGFLEAAILETALLPLNARRPAVVTFNLSELYFISSLVLGILVRFCRSAARNGGRVRLTALQPQVRESIEQAGLVTLLLEQDAAEAAQDGAANLAPVNA
jgi:anti-anti-sigma factor